MDTRAHIIMQIVRPVVELQTSAEGVGCLSNQRTVFREKNPFSLENATAHQFGAG